jgi:hypothetical protein
MWKSQSWWCIDPACRSLSFGSRDLNNSLVRSSLELCILNCNGCYARPHTLLLSYFAISTPLVAPVFEHTVSHSQSYAATAQQEERLTKSLLDITIDSELSSSQTANHEQSRRQTSKRSTKTQFASNLDQTRNRALTRHTLGLVDLREHGISGLRDDGSSETSKETRAEVYACDCTGAQGRLVTHGCKDGFGELLESEEFGDGVGNPVFLVSLVSCSEQRCGLMVLLLEQDWTET